MKKEDFYLSILIGIISGLIVLLGSFVGENIKNVGLKIGVTVAMCFILFVIFIKIIENKGKRK
jgi:uncharacterized membrane protein YfcA